jgi:hypothetical protein
MAMKRDERGEKRDATADSRKQEAGARPREQHGGSPDPEQGADRDPAPCDVCGVAALIWRKCKLVCENCGAVNKTCADL